MHGLRAAAARYPRVLDAAFAALVAALSAVSLGGRTEVTGTAPTALDWMATGALVVPLVWRRRAPLVIFFVIAGLLGLSDLAGADSPAMLFAPLVAIYAIARHRSRRYLWPAIAGIALTLLASLLQSELTWPDLAAITAMVAASVLLGTNLRTRQAYLAELEERARRLERERDQQAQLAVAGERVRIAREMHDIVAHNLAVMVALADGAAATATTTPQRAAYVMQQVSTTGRQALGEMRRLVGLLRGGAPEVDADDRAPQPGLDDIDRLVEQVRAAGVRIALTREGVPGSWGPGAGLAVYRIVQEALTNTLKHAGPRATAQVRLRYTPEGADVEVVDDGAGRPARAVAPTNRHGLAGMLERASSYDGRVDAGPRPGVGWQVRAHLRFNDASGTA